MKALAILVPAAFLAVAGPAFAVDYDSARVTSMNQQTGQVVLSNGHQYTVQNPSQMLGVMPGDQVIVTFQGHTAVGFADDPSQFETASSPAP